MSRMTEGWITDRRPLPVDANQEGCVLVRRMPHGQISALLHHTYVGIGTPWCHAYSGWKFPEIRVGQVWRCADGVEVKVKARNGSDDNFPFEIVTNGGLSIWYDNQGSTAFGWNKGFRLAELISEPEPESESESEPAAEQINKAVRQDMEAAAQAYLDRLPFPVPAQTIDAQFHDSNPRGFRSLSAYVNNGAVQLFAVAMDGTGWFNPYWTMPEPYSQTSWLPIVPLPND